jgi:methionyl aminopeptidase
LDLVGSKVKAGVSTQALNDYAEELIARAGGAPAFKNYKGYPATLCTSVNSQIVHGIPSEKVILENGDIIGLDLGLVYQGMVTDMARTFAVGKISKEAKKLIQVTRECLTRAIKEIAPGKHLGDLSFAVQSHAEKNGFSVVRELVGHGVGREVHEDPPIPNYGEKGTDLILKPGMTLAIEPMINLGQWPARFLKDGWTVETRDGSLSAHFEHTVAVTEDGYEILTEL